MRRVIAFDVNETLLDLRALDGLFGDAAARRAVVRADAPARVRGRDHRPRTWTSPTAQRAALEMLGDGPDPDEVAAAMRSLPLHPRRGAGARPAARGRADAVLADELVARERRPRSSSTRASPTASRRSCRPTRCGRLKPAPEPYRHVAETFGVEIGDVTLVACHAWDCAGALAAGCQAAFVRRPGMALCPVGEQPGIVGGDLDEVAAQLLAPPSGCARGWPCGPAPAAGRSPSAAPP